MNQQHRITKVINNFTNEVTFQIQTSIDPKTKTKYKSTHDTYYIKKGEKELHASNVPGLHG